MYDSFACGVRPGGWPPQQERCACGCVLEPMRGRILTKLLYIAGTSFCGSTLLSALLDSHPEIASVGEATGPFKGIPDRARYPCSCGKPLAECELWRRVGAAMAARGFAFDPQNWDMRFELGGRLSRHLLVRSFRSNELDSLRDALVLASPYAPRMRKLAERNVALVESVLEVTGRRVFADASKDVARVRHLDRLTTLKPAVIDLSRDSLGYVASHVENWREYRPADATVDFAITVWRRHRGHVRRLFALLPEHQKLRVRYEDLACEPMRELRRIADFAGVPSFTGQLEVRAATHHLIGNRMRLRSSSKIRLDERWRERLSPAEIAQVKHATARERAELGYVE